MGGGSGRYHYSDTKRITEDYSYIDIRQWGPEELISGKELDGYLFCSGDKTSSLYVKLENDSVFLKFLHRNTYAYCANIEWTECHYGGRRPWFICPSLGCYRRVAILYSGSFFACRHCCNLSYLSQREDAWNRNIRKSRKIGKKLGWQCGVYNGRPEKPKGMHIKTFIRLMDDYKRLIYKID